MTTKKIENNKIAVAVSGNGRSLENLIRQQNCWNYQVAAVIASSPGCKALKIAKNYQIDTFIGEFNEKTLPTLKAPLYQWLDNLEINLIALAGFLRKFPMHSDWDMRILNIHPGLLPKYGGIGMYGDRVHKAVLAAGDRQSGASVHFVTSKYDEGPVIAQSYVKIHQDDDYASLSARVFSVECLLYPQVISELLDGSLPLANHQIRTFQHDN
ncbi:MAG: formyltransferase family protein [Bdellovibrionota bacterium]